MTNEQKKVHGCSRRVLRSRMWQQWRMAVVVNVQVGWVSGQYAMVK